MGDKTLIYLLAATVAAIVLAYMHLMGGVPIREHGRQFVPQLRKHAISTVLILAAALAFNVSMVLLGWGKL